MKKTLITILATVLVCACLVGGTLAWLTDSTDEVKNTFTVGDINITLTETTQEDEEFKFKMVPGNDIDKDPTITVEANSEDCWLFVKVTESTNLKNFINYVMADGWTLLESNNGEYVYYRAVTLSTSDQDFAVLKDNKVTVDSDVTKAMMDEITAGTATNPTLTFKAYAVQKGTFTAASAWNEVKGA